MNIGNVKQIKPAKKYAYALLYSAIETQKEEKVLQDITFIIETINLNSNLSEFLYNPAIKFEDKKDVIIKLFSPHTETISTDFICLLAEKGRLNILNEILNQYKGELTRRKNIVTPVIISAIELKEEQKTRIIEKLANKLNKTIQPEYIINTDIIGGLIIEIEDKTIDCSIKTKFDNMKKQLTKGNSYGNN